MPTVDLSSYHQNAGTTSDGSKFNNLIDAIQTFANGIDNNNIAAAAAIALTKLAQSGATAGQAVTWNGTAWVAGNASGKTAHGKTTANVSTSGTTFGAGVDVLAAALSFTADGSADYILSIFAFDWRNDTVNDEARLHINLDGADVGMFANTRATVSTNDLKPLAASGLIVAPSAGAHTVNVRLRANLGGTALIEAGAGGSGNIAPILVTIEKA